jgi:hypothetical protein
MYRESGARRKRRLKKVMRVDTTICEWIGLVGGYPRSVVISIPSNPVNL